MNWRNFQREMKQFFKQRRRAHHICHSYHSSTGWLQYSEVRNRHWICRYTNQWKLSSSTPSLTASDINYTGQNVEAKGSWAWWRITSPACPFGRGRQHPNLLEGNWMKSLPSILLASSRSHWVDSSSWFVVAGTTATFFRRTLWVIIPPVKFQFKPEHQKRFFKARTVLYAVALKVEEEIDRLLKMDIIDPVQYFEWAAPVVPVQKPDGSARLWGDYTK